MRKILIKILPVFLVFIAVSLACSAPLKALKATPSQGRETSATSTPDITQATQTPDLGPTATIEVQSGSNGAITIILTESQINTYLQNQLKSQPDIPFKNAQVTLNDNEIDVTGDVTVGPITSQSTIILQPYVDHDKLKIKILSAKLGAFPFPENVLKNLDLIINQNLDQLVTKNNVTISVQTVSVTKGLMTITGTTQ